MSTAGTIGFIFARGGSKGIPRKNLAMLAGESLLAHAIRTARECGRLERVVVSTDDEEIAEVAAACGAEVPFMRPAELAGDKSFELDAWRHAISAMNSLGTPCKVFVSIPTTAPLRKPHDIAACLDLYGSDSDCDVVITVRDAERNPYFNMIQVAGDGACRLAVTGLAAATRQSAPLLFDVTTAAYVVRPSFIMTAKSYWEGRVRAVRLPWTRALDIDTPFDLQLANLLLRENLVENEVARAINC